MKSLTIAPPLARAGIDRDAEAREDPELFDRILAEPGTRILALNDGKVPISDGRIVLCAPDVAASALVRVYLGRSIGSDSREPEGTAIILHIVDDGARAELDARLGPGIEWAELRDVGGDLSARDAGMLVEALAVARWHTNYAYCPRCGLPNIVRKGGWVRQCPNDGFEVYPRIDPAVIVAIRDTNDRLLLGGGRGNWYSVLAGFVEAGEPVEAAVLREVHEESGLTVSIDGYLGSQSWPYPLSLMLAFSAVVTDADPDAALTPDGQEITHLEWFSREELVRRRHDLRLPGTSSIARAMIEAWLGAPLDTAGNSVAAHTELAEPTPAPNTFLAGTDIP